MSEQQRIELYKLLDQADMYRGVHKKVESKNIYSPGYIRRFRNGERNIPDYNKAQKLIDAYNIELQKIKEKIRNIEVK